MYVEVMPGSSPYLVSMCWMSLCVHCFRLNSQNLVVVERGEDFSSVILRSSDLWYRIRRAEPLTEGPSQQLADLP